MSAARFSFAIKIVYMMSGIAIAAQPGPGRQIMNEDFFAFCLGPPEGRAVSVRIECAP